MAIPEPCDFCEKNCHCIATARQVEDARGRLFQLAPPETRARDNATRPHNRYLRTARDSYWILCLS